MADVIRFENLTPAQQDAVTRQGNVLVSAAAGSGKTTALLARIKYKLLEGVDLKRMLILVYNNAAADELKEKLRNELFYSACAESGERSKLFRKQLDELSFASISTIHSFCRASIKSKFEVLGISPSFSVLDERAHTAYMNKALDTVFSAYSEAGDETFFRLSVVFEKSRTEDNLRSNVIRLFNLMEVQPDREEFKKNLRNCYSGTDFFDSVIRDNTARVAKKIQSTLKDVMPFLDGAFLDNAQLALDGCKVLLSGDKDAILAFYGEYAPVQTRKNNKVDAGAYYASKNCIERVGEELSLYFTIYGDRTLTDKAFEQNGEFVLKLLEITERFSEELTALKKEDDVLAFSDLEHKMMELLDSGADLASDYDCVFVDEYQDVNPLQEYVISRLVRDNAFMVGDVKQSIYGFRLADPTIFQSKFNELEAAAERGEGKGPISFLDNFRSENQILQFVNGVFDVIMTVDSADLDYKNKARFNDAKDRDGNLKAEGGVEIHLFNLPSQKKPVAQGLYMLPDHEEYQKPDGNTECEARFIASEIKKLKGKAIFRNRRLNYGDFAVLFRKRNAAANRIVEILREEGLPVDDGSFSKTESGPERELVNFLRVLDNPRQDYYLAGYLLSYFGGYSEDELAVVAPRREGDLYDAVLGFVKRGGLSEKEYAEQGAPGDSPLAKKLNDTLGVLESYRVKASFKNVAELMSTIVSETGYDAYIRLQGEAAAAALDGFINSLKDAGTVGLSSFLADYGTLSAEDRRSSGGDRVHVSTFHGYKGLEIPVVFVANIGAEIAQPRSTDLLMCGKGYVGVSYFDLDNKVQYADTLSKKALEFMIHDKEYKEEMRLLYVALTRAQKLLYLTGGLSARKILSEDEFAEKIAEADFDYEKRNLEFLYAAMTQRSVDVPVIRHTSMESVDERKEKPLLDIPGSRYVEAIKRAQSFVYPHEEASRLAMKYSVTALESADEDTVRVFEERANVGTAYHKVMQYADFDVTDVDGVRHEIEKMKEDNLLSEEDAALVKPEEIVAALNSDVVRLASVSRVEREKPFMLYAHADEVVPDCTVKDKVLVQGIIDLLILGEQNVIVDYKYSALKDAEALKKYEKQLYLYKKAVETAFSIKIDRLVLLSLKTGKSYDIV